MGNLADEEAMEGLPSIRVIKVHAQMCSKLSKVVIKVSNVYREIEETRPRCSSGIEALCLLNNGISKATSLIQQCSESSALYLSFTGKVILTRCKKSCNMMEQSLSQLQNMVPVILAAKISGIIVDLRSTSFYRDQSEEEAEKILKELIHRYSNSKLDSTDYTTVADIHAIASRLRISSQKSLLIEKRAIRRIGQTEPSKKGIMVFFLELLKIYGNLISSNSQRGNEHSEDNSSSFPFSSNYQLSKEIELAVEHRSYDNQIDVLTSPIPPEEFLCPLSSRLMSDPVVVASGQTYEKTWIQRWFDEGKTTCPSTKVELENFSYTPNTNMKLLIQKWCSMHNVSVADHSLEAQSLDMSTNSIASLSSSINDLNLRLDYSNVSLGSSSQGSEYSFSRTANDVEPSSFRDMELPSGFDSLPWDHRCKAIEDLRKLLEKNEDELWPMMTPEVSIKQIASFLKDAHRIHDEEALMNGCLLLLEFVQKQRNSEKYIDEEACALLASLLDTEAAPRALSIFKALSSHQNGCENITNSGAFFSILTILETLIQEYQEQALYILANLSSIRNLHGLIDPWELIPKLIPFLKNDDTLGRHCLTILNGNIAIEGVRRSIAETDGCIASIANLLDSDSLEAQENAVSILLSLCSQRSEYCRVVMDEGVIPGLVSVSVNGNKRGKAMAMELLRILRIELDSDGKISEVDFGVATAADTVERRTDECPTKSRRLFKKIFSKQANKK